MRREDRNSRPIKFIRTNLVDLDGRGTEDAAAAAGQLRLQALHGGGRGRGRARGRRGQGGDQEGGAGDVLQLLLKLGLTK
jgi:hypothetical protein